ncbi:hypothetical protein Tco_0513279 [Tanacetum coccineum]
MVRKDDYHLQKPEKKAVATYQMVRSHPRFKHHTNEQCNKIPPLLKVSDEDKNNGISHPYQKLKGFYKGVLNLGPDYIRDAKTEEWLTRGHISVHEMEWTLMKEVSTNIGGEFTNLEILKCMDLETSKATYNTHLAKKLQLRRIYRENIREFSF